MKPVLHILYVSGQTSSLVGRLLREPNPSFGTHLPTKRFRGSLPNPPEPNNLPFQARTRNRKANPNVSEPHQTSRSYSLQDLAIYPQHAGSYPRPTARSQASTLATSCSVGPVAHFGPGNPNSHPMLRDRVLSVRGRSNNRSPEPKRTSFRSESQPPFVPQSRDLQGSDSLPGCASIGRNLNQNL